MKRREKILDDAARLAGGAAGLLGDAGKNAAAMLRSRLDEWAQSMDLVPREDFERLELLLQQARLEQERLKKRLDVVEKKLTGTKKKVTKKGKKDA